MAELLGVAASGMNVVSLAFQIAESLKKLKDLCDLMKAAPEAIRLAIDEVETLSMILEDIDRDMQAQYFPDQKTKAAVLKSYKLCKNSNEALKALVAGLEQDLNKGRKRGRFKIAMRQNKTEALKNKLESAKATMLLANQCYDRALQKQNWKRLELELVELQCTLSRMPNTTAAISSELCNDRNASPVQGDFDCTFRTQAYQRPKRGSNWTHRARTRHQQCGTLWGFLDIVTCYQRHATSTSVSIVLPKWIYARKFQVYMTRSYQGWDQSLRVYKTIPHGAPIFRCCKEGHVNGLQHLFESDLASPFEVNPDGMTPLHWAALWAQPHACRFLLERGADVNARTSLHTRFLSLGYDERGVWYRSGIQYSTPLQILASNGSALKDLGRETHRYHKDAGPNINEKFQNTIEVLVAMGDSDPFHTDQYGRNTFHLFHGPSSTYNWLKHHKETGLACLSPQERYEILEQRLWSSWENSVQLFQDMLPYDTITEGLTQYIMNIRYLEGLNFLHTAVFRWTQSQADEGGEAYQSSPEYQAQWESLITELIMKGPDVHNFRSGPSIASPFSEIDLYDTPLSTIIRSIPITSSRPSRRAKQVIKVWLRLLHDAGVDLEEYGRVENALRESGKISRVFYAFMGRCWNGFEITKLWIGKTPDDFCVELEDLYATNELAADFWLWVEGPFDEDAKVQEMPGGWPAD